MATHSCIGGNGNPLMPTESHGQRSLVGYGPWAKSQTRLKLLSTHAHMRRGTKTFWINDLFCLREPRMYFRWVLKYIWTLNERKTL